MSERLPLTVHGAFLGRPIKPLSLALCIALAVVFVINVTNIGILKSAESGDVLGACALVASTVLLIAWWARSQRFSELGLLLAAGVWGGRFVLGLLIDGWSGYGAYLSFAWMVAAGGAYLLEREESNGRRRVRSGR